MKIIASFVLCFILSSCDASEHKPHVAIYYGKEKLGFLKKSKCIKYSHGGKDQIISSTFMNQEINHCSFYSKDNSKVMDRYEFQLADGSLLYFLGSSNGKPKDLKELVNYFKPDLVICGTCDLPTRNFREIMIRSLDAQSGKGELTLESPEFIGSNYMNEYKRLKAVKNFEEKTARLKKEVKLDEYLSDMGKAWKEKEIKVVIYRYFSINEQLLFTDLIEGFSPWHVIYELEKIHDMGGITASDSYYELYCTPFVETKTDSSFNDRKKLNSTGSIMLPNPLRISGEDSQKIPWGWSSLNHYVKHGNMALLMCGVGPIDQLPDNDLRQLIISPDDIKPDEAIKGKKIEYQKKEMIFNGLKTTYGVLKPISIFAKSPLNVKYDPEYAKYLEYWYPKQEKN